AEGEHEVGAAGCGEIGELGGEVDDLDPGKACRIGLHFGSELRIEFYHARLGCGRSGCRVGRDIEAAVLQVRGENLGPVAGSSRRDFDHYAVGLDVEELQDFVRPTKGIANRVGWSALLAADQCA